MSGFRSVRVSSGATFRAGNPALLDDAVREAAINLLRCQEKETLLQACVNAVWGGSSERFAAHTRVKEVAKQYADRLMYRNLSATEADAIQRAMRKMHADGSAWRRTPEEAKDLREKTYGL